MSIATDVHRSVLARLGVRGAQPRRPSFAWLFMAPTVIALAVVVAAPLFYSLYLSFHAYIITYGMGGFVGLENYLQVIATDVDRALLSDRGRLRLRLSRSGHAERVGRVCSDSWRANQPDQERDGKPIDGRSHDTSTVARTFEAICRVERDTIGPSS